MASKPYYLSSKGFIYDPIPAEDGRCPCHVELLRKSLLDFSCPQPRGAFFRDSARLNSVLVDTEGKKATDIRLIPSGIIQQDALDKVSQSSDTEAWMKFYEGHFFNKLTTSVLNQTDRRISSRAHFYYDAVVLERNRNRKWDVFCENEVQLAEVSPTMPSFAFFLPIYETTSNLSPIRPKVEQWPSPPDPASAEPFTWSTLYRLSVQGLRPFPRAEDMATASSSPSKLRCYPWLIAVTCDDADGSSLEAVRQASEATTSALFMQRRLTQYSTVLKDQAHVLPIPAMTALGPDVTIWIAYYAKDFVQEKHSKSCGSSDENIHHGACILQAIWKGNMTILRDIILLDMILENIYTWAMRVFKPCVATYINQWKFCHPQEDRQESSASTKVIVESVQAQHSGRNPPPSVGSTIEIDSLSQKHAYKLSTSEREKLLEDVDRLVVQKVQELIKTLGLTLPSASAGMTVEAGMETTKASSKVSDSTLHISDAMEMDQPSESTSYRMPLWGGSGESISVSTPFNAIPVITSTDSSTALETERDDLPTHRPVSASPRPKNRFNRPLRRPRSFSSIGLASTTTSSSTDAGLGVKSVPQSGSHLSPNVPGFTLQRPASADGSFPRTDAANEKQLLTAGHPESNYRLPTGNFFGLVNMGNLGDGREAAESVFNHVATVPVALLNRTGYALNSSRPIVPNSGAKKSLVADGDMDISDRMEMLHFANRP